MYSHVWMCLIFLLPVMLLVFLKFMSQARASPDVLPKLPWRLLCQVMAVCALGVLAFCFA